MIVCVQYGIDEGPLRYEVTRALRVLCNAVLPGYGTGKPLIYI